jgi:Dolichyl-phosphate-mannose-protein mannosyltransferase
MNSTERRRLRDPRAFRIGLAVIVVLALALRVAWVLVARRNFALHGDDYFYHWQANALADGMGFVNPFAWKALGRIEPSAAHPPLYPLYLSGFSWLGFATPLAHRLASCLLGAGGVLLVGLAGRRIAGPRAGLLAAGVAAVYPMLWINDGMLTSESMYVLIVAGMILAAYRLWDDRTWLNAGILGATIGLASLTRPEAIVLVPFIGLPYLFARGSALRRRVALFLVIGAVCLVVILPWWARNVATFSKPTFLATGNGSVLQIANCDTTYSGPLLGYWDIQCAIGDRPPANAAQRKLQESTKVPGLVYLIAQDPRDESIPDATARSKGLHYIRDHLDRAPIVAAARVARVWGIFRVQQQVDFDVFFERRGRVPSWAGTFMYFALLPIAGCALVVMYRRRTPISPMLAIFAMVTVTTAVSIGITRYRVGADVALAVLGGVGIDAVWHRLRRTAPAAAPETRVPETVAS